MNTTSRKAAEYVRMSTEMQRYSIENQKSEIHSYAQENNIEIVKTYSDGGRSGLGIQRRDALRQLLSDVSSGHAIYNTILVYDISRWGRFQDADESAHYEFICRQAGIQVIYCAEPFENDGSPMASIIKGLKRVMAGEYSRELSTKVFQGQSRLAMLGFHVGGRACYGMRRMIIDANSRPRCVLEFGEQKAMQSDRIVLVHGPEGEVDAVRKIFEWFINEQITYLEIAHRLSALPAPPPAGLKTWTRDAVRRILSNEKYTGTMVYNRTSSRLAMPKKRNPTSAWIRTTDAFEPIIGLKTFSDAQERISSNPRRYPRQFLVNYLQKVLESHGRLSTTLLRELKGGPAPETLRKHFGSIDEAFSAVGYDRLLDPNPPSRRWLNTRSVLNEAVPLLIQSLRILGIDASRCSLQSLRLIDGRRINVTVPWPSSTRSSLIISMDKSAAALVVIGVNFPGLPGSCLVCNPKWHPHQTLALSSHSRLEKILPWVCESKQLPQRLSMLLLNNMESTQIQ